jgi:CDP-4-dehydro-6-deoxyglucose reductase, E1
MNIKKNKITYGKNVYDKNEINAVLRTLNKSTQMGDDVINFENKISKLLNKKYSLMVNSGSSALLLAMTSLNLPKGSNVITPALTFGTTIASIVQSGFIPNLIDVNISTLCIDENKIEKSINKKTKAMLIPNLIGLLPDWPKLKKIAKKYNLILIEDSADTLDSKYNDKPTSSYSDITITSFYGSHIISCAGNGGIVCFNNKNYFEKAKLLRSWGRSSSLFKESEKIENRFDIKLSGIRYDKKFIFQELGYNFEPSEIGASFGLVQLKKLNKNITKRKKLRKHHDKFFERYKDIFILPKNDDYQDSALLAYPIILKNSLIDRTDLQIFLEKNNIQTRVIFTGNILRQPCSKNVKFIKETSYKNSDKVMRDGMLIGCHQGLSIEELNYIHKTIEKFLKIKKIKN